MLIYKEDLYEQIYDRMREFNPMLWELINNMTEKEKKKLMDVALNHCSKNLLHFISNKCDTIEIGRAFILQHKKAKNKIYVPKKIVIRKKPLL